MSAPTRCPYCDNGSFTADFMSAGPAKEDSVGDWYNQCAKCLLWSKYEDEPSPNKDSRQVEIKNPDVRPKPWPQ